MGKKLTSVFFKNKKERKHAATQRDLFRSRFTVTALLCKLNVICYEQYINN